MKKSDVLIVGSGMGALTAAVLLANKGLKVRIIEQNWQPGGCTSSYWRKGYVFEAGATTLVGLGEGMPLQYVLDETGIEIPVRKLELPMQVHLKDGSVVNRFQNLQQWISESERVFGLDNQKEFWGECYKLSQFVWKNSLRQLSFPPSNFKDLLKAAASSSFAQISNLPHAFHSVDHMLRKFNLDENTRFVDFVNEQLLITAQNQKDEVNFLFGAAALCYTNYPNYYVDGGLLNLVKPLVEFIESKGGEIIYREEVKSVEHSGDEYLIKTPKAEYQAEYLISGIPFNNTLELFKGKVESKMKAKALDSPQLNSAFQMGIGFIPHRDFDSIHHQIHLSKPLAETGSASIFISLNHPEDQSRTDEPGHAVMSVSTHHPDPANKIIDRERGKGSFR